MFLKKAEGRCFRNYKEFSIEFTSHINIFTGDNGQGKSSFLEALYCCLRGKSFYPFVGSQFIKSGEKKASVFLTLEESNGLSTLSADFFFYEKKLKKDFFYCGKKIGQPFLLKKFPNFVFTEESMKCIRQGFDQRRSFVDEMLGVGHQKQVKEDFNRVLKEKQKLLKSVKKEMLSVKEAEKVLEALNYNFLQLSVQLVQERLKVLKNLFISLADVKKEFFKAPYPYLDFSYCLSRDQELSENVNILSTLEKDLRQKRELEIQVGSVLSGPQRHEIYFLFNGEDSRVFCSKGEQRAFVLSLLGSCINKISGAFLFLDDVLMELDGEMQKRFLKFLEKRQCQVFLTNCSLTPIRTKKMSFFSVENAIISKYD